MPVTVNITALSSTDAVPAAAPYKLGPAAGNHLDVTFLPVHDGNLVPGQSLLPTDGEIYPALLDTSADPVPNADLLPDRGAAIPGPSNIPLFPDVAGVFPSNLNQYPGRDILSYRDVVAWVLREGGSDAYTGKAVKFAGCRCGPLPCSSRRLASQSDYRLVSGYQDSTVVTFPDADDGGGDGLRNAALWVTVENQGTG